jgi:hypothetical protein
VPALDPALAACLQGPNPGRREEIKNYFAGISLQPATPYECRLNASDMLQRDSAGLISENGVRSEACSIASKVAD